MRDSDGPAGQGVYAPPLDHDRMGAAADGSRRATLIFALIVIVIAAGAGFLFLMFGPRGTAPVIAADGPYKTAAEAAQAAEAPDLAVYDLMEGAPARAQPLAPPQPSALGLASDGESPPAPAPPVADRPSAPAAPLGRPAFAADGAWVAQVAALRSDAAAREAWARLIAAHGDLLAGALMDVQRADLGPQGVYFRLRAGYFASRENASAFCEQLQAAGRDCLVAARAPG